MLRWTDFSLNMWWYAGVGFFVLVICAFNLYFFGDAANRYFIRSFGKERLKAERRKIALVIVSALFDRQQQCQLPENDDDLVIREAALNFVEFFEG